MAMASERMEEAIGRQRDQIDIMGEMADVGESVFDRLIDGAVSWKDALTEIGLELIRLVTMQNLMNRGFVQPGEGIGGALMRNFLGMFDNGGTIGSGQWGIVGERGPEIVSGPATVTSRADTARMMRQSVDVRVIGGDLTVSDNGQVMARVRVAAAMAQQGAVSTVRQSLAGWQDEMAVHGALA